MFEHHPIALAALTGFVSGLLLSIPVGPINLTIINEGARRGFWWAFLIGLGAVAMEVVYCALAFTGFASFFTRGYVKIIMELTSFAFLLFLGLKFLLAKSVSAAAKIIPVKSPIEQKIGERIEEKLHPHSAFVIGAVRVMGNPGVFVFWIVLAANFISREWVPATAEGKLACISGVAAGIFLWFLALSWAVSLGHGRFRESTLLRIERISGLVLLGLAAAHGGHLAWELAHHSY